jgi:GNAT superfamily N-acetyltransferase
MRPSAASTPSTAATVATRAASTGLRWSPNSGAGGLSRMTASVPACMPAKVSCRVVAMASVSTSVPVTSATPASTAKALAARRRRRASSILIVVGTSMSICPTKLVTEAPGSKCVPGRAPYPNPHTVPQRRRCPDWSGFLPAYRDRAGRAQHMEERHSHDPPHWYLFILAAEQAAQGRGLGSALPPHMLDRVDANGMPGHLESSNERNIALCARYGFEVTGGGAIPGGPTIWPVWREPHP